MATRRIPDPKFGVRFPRWSVCFCKSNTAKLPRENGMSLPEGTLLRSWLASLPDTVEYQARAVEAPVISDSNDLNVAPQPLGHKQNFVSARPINSAGRVTSS